MIPAPFPTVKSWPLPREAHALPQEAPATPLPDDDLRPRSAAEDPKALSEAIAPAVSAAIARRARQRRFA